MRVTVDETELESLVQQLRNGDNSVSERIIIHFLGLARSLSRHAVARHPHKIDDIRASAVFGLVQAVRWAPSRMWNNNIGAYINITVRRFIREFLEHDHIIRIPKDEWSKMIEHLKLDELEDSARIKALKELKKCSMVFQASVSDGVGGFLEDFVEGSPGLSVITFDSDSIIVEDMKRFLKLTYFERAILDFRIQGYTLKEVGARLRKSDVAIHKTLRKLQDRYRLIQRAHPSLPGPPDAF